MSTSTSRLVNERAYVRRDHDVAADSRSRATLRRLAVATATGALTLGILAGSGILGVRDVPAGSGGILADVPWGGGSVNGSRAV